MSTHAATPEAIIWISDLDVWSMNTRRENNLLLNTRDFRLIIILFKVIPVISLYLYIIFCIVFVIVDLCVKSRTK